MQRKKYIPLEIEENLEDTNDNIDNNNLGLIEVKNRKFNLYSQIENKVLYGNNIFYLDSHKHYNYPKNINYKCLNYRKAQKE